MITHTRGFSVEAPGTRSVAWVAKGNKVIFELDCLCSNSVPNPKWTEISQSHRHSLTHCAPDREQEQKGKQDSQCKLAQSLM